MIIFDTNEQVEFLATQCFNYDKYACCTYFLEQVNVDGKLGLICGEESDEYGTHAKVLVQPTYTDIQIRKISSHKAIYKKYAVFGNGSKIGEFTLVLNAWVPRPYAQN